MSIMMEAFLRAAGISTPMGRTLDRFMGESEKDDKKCKCGDKPCACVAFAPFFGDGKGHSGATMPKNNVKSQDQHELPRGTPSPANNDADSVDGVPVTPTGPTPGAAPIAASCDDEEDEMEPKSERTHLNPLASLNEGLDFMTRSFGAPTMVIPPSPSVNTLNPMTDVVMDEIDELGLDLGPMSSPTVGPMPVNHPADPLSPMAYGNEDDDDCGVGCSAHLDPEMATGFEDLDDLEDDDVLDLPPGAELVYQPTGHDVLMSVLTILNAAMVGESTDDKIVAAIRKASSKGSAFNTKIQLFSREDGQWEMIGQYHGNNAEEQAAAAFKKYAMKHDELEIRVDGRAVRW